MNRGSFFCISCIFYLNLNLKNKRYEYKTKCSTASSTCSCVNIGVYGQGFVPLHTTCPCTALQPAINVGQAAFEPFPPLRANRVCLRETFSTLTATVSKCATERSHWRLKKQGTRGVFLNERFGEGNHWLVGPQTGQDFILNAWQAWSILFELTAHWSMKMSTANESNI